MDIMDTIKDQITANRVDPIHEGVSQPASVRLFRASGAGTSGCRRTFCLCGRVVQSRDSRQSPQIRELANLSAAVGRWRADRRLRHHHGDG